MEYLDNHLPVARTMRGSLPHPHSAEARVRGLIPGDPNTVTVGSEGMLNLAAAHQRDQPSLMISE